MVVTAEVVRVNTALGIKMNCVILTCLAWTIPDQNRLIFLFFAKFWDYILVSNFILIALFNYYFFSNNSDDHILKNLKHVLSVRVQSKYRRIKVAIWDSMMRQILKACILRQGESKSLNGRFNLNYLLLWPILSQILRWNMANYGQIDIKVAKILSNFIIFVVKIWLHIGPQI